MWSIPFKVTRLTASVLSPEAFLRLDGSPTLVKGCKCGFLFKRNLERRPVVVAGWEKDAIPDFSLSSAQVSGGRGSFVLSRAAITKPQGNSDHIRGDCFHKEGFGKVFFFSLHLLELAQKHILRFSYCIFIQVKNIIAPQINNKVGRSSCLKITYVILFSSWCVWVFNV